MTANPPSSEFRGPAFLRLDLPGLTAQPALWRWVVGTVVAIAVSLAACFGLAHLAMSLDPSLVGYGHFAFSDYSRLTILGVLGACIGWPVVCALTTRAPRLYLWLGVAATIVSLAPDLWIWHLGQPAAGVATLAVMHVALGVITVVVMVFGAPQRHARGRRVDDSRRRSAAG